MTKQLPLFLFILFLIPRLPAQNCTPSYAVDFLHANSIYARVNSGGALFGQSQFIPNPQPDDTGPSTFYGAALWIGTKTPDGQLKLNASTYSGYGSYPGPLNDSGFTDSLNCLNWERVFKITGADIPVFLKNLQEFNTNPDLAIQLFPQIMGWPAQSNPFFAAVNGFDLPIGRPMAPFFDENGDGSYNPLQGDYPVVELENNVRFVPAQWTWSVYNGFGAPATSTETRYNIQAEIQMTAWAFHCTDQPELENTVFTAHRVIFRSQESLDSCFVGMWADFDIGCTSDDYVGCRPDMNTFFAYNMDAVDGSIGANCFDSSMPFSQNPPAQSATFLNKSMDKFMYYNHPGNSGAPAYSTDAHLPIEFYRYLSGFWKDGTPLIFGGNGYNPNGTIVDHAFSGDPGDALAWTMCNSLQSSGDRRALGSHYLGHVEPGRQEEFVFAWTYHPNINLPCNLGTTFDEIAVVRAIYDNDFGGVCSPVSATPEPNQDFDAVEMYPNPASRELTLFYGDRVLHEIRLLAPDGRLVRRVTSPQPQQTILQINDLVAGVYVVQCIVGRQSLARKVALQRE